MENEPNDILQIGEDIGAYLAIDPPPSPLELRNHNFALSKDIKLPHSNL